MALPALKTFAAGEVLTANDLNSMNTHILINATRLISPLTGSLDAGAADITNIDEMALNDAAADPSANGRLRRNGASLVWRVEDARTATPVNALILQATTTGVPTAGLGTNLDFRAESADENPSDFGRIRADEETVGGGEDTEFQFHLRTAGAVLTIAMGMESTEGGLTFRISTAPSPPAANTLYVRLNVRHWGSVSSVPALLDSYFIDSVTDAGVGLVTINLNGSFTTVNHVIVGSTRTGAAIVGFDSFDTNLVRAVLTDNAGTATDLAFSFVTLGPG